MSELRDRAREKIAKLVYSKWCEEYGWKDRWEDVRDKTKEQYLEDADEILAIPELAIVDRDASLMVRKGYVKEIV